MDMLTEMFVAQHRLQRESMGIDPIALPTSARIEYIKECVLAALDELHEALNETGWKHWAKSNHVNGDAMLDELVDVWHFIMNLALASGVHDTPEATAAEFVERYFKKRERNAQRQVEGYDGVSNKCPHCKRAYDDEHVECRPAGVAGVLGDRAYCAHEEVYF